MFFFLAKFFGSLVKLKLNSQPLENINVLKYVKKFVETQNDIPKHYSEESMVSYFVSHLKQFFNCYPSHNKVQEILNNLIILPSNINLLILSHLEEAGTSRVSEKRRH